MRKSEDGMTALLIEDDPFFLRFMTRILEKRGYTVIPVMDAEQATAEMERNRFELVVIDLRLPGDCGPRLLEQIEKTDHMIDRSVVVTAFPFIGRSLSNRIPIVDKARLGDLVPHLKRIEALGPVA